MGTRRFTAAVAAALCTILLTAGTTSAAADGATPTPTPTQDLLRSWGTSGGGTLAGAGGRQLAQAQQGTQVVVPSARAAAAAYPPCQGTFPSDGFANIIVQESAASGIPWRVALGSVNSSLGVVRLSAQIYADNRQANVYAPHTEPWNYTFHGPLPRTFQVVGGGTYKMPAGATVSFLFTWYSVAQPSRGGYAYLNCRFAI